MRGAKVRIGIAEVALIGLLVGCGAPARPQPTPIPPTPAVVQVPDDGVSLAQLGFTNGPVEAFTLPRNVVISTSVDQPNGVTVVFGRPSPAELAQYLRRVLPATGFVITQDEPATTTMTFTGYGWQGSFTGTGSSSAVILRP